MIVMILAVNVVFWRPLVTMGMPPALPRREPPGVLVALTAGAPADALVLRATRLARSAGATCIVLPVLLGHHPMLREPARRSVGAEVHVLPAEGRGWRRAPTSQVTGLSRRFRCQGQALGR